MINIAVVRIVDLLCACFDHTHRVFDGSSDRNEILQGGVVDSFKFDENRVSAVSGVCGPNFVLTPMTRACAANRHVMMM